MTTYNLTLKLSPETLGIILNVAILRDRIFQNPIPGHTEKYFIKTKCPSLNIQKNENFFALFSKMGEEIKKI